MLSTNNLRHRTGTLDHYQQAVERAIAYMRHHFNEPLELPELARVAGLSKYHFVRVFSEVTFTTPAHFLSSIRIERAKQLLADTTASITDVCLEVGYSAVGTFSSTFARLVGYSPTAYRQLPREFPTALFREQIERHIAGERQLKGPTVEGMIAASEPLLGIVFVGAFTSAVPQGAPIAGTALFGPGAFQFKRPSLNPFYVLSAFIPVNRQTIDLCSNLDVALVGSLRVNANDEWSATLPPMEMRPVRPTDPPLVAAFPALLKS